MYRPPTKARIRSWCAIPTVWPSVPNALLTIIPVISVAEAVDTPIWGWSLGGYSPWVGQSAVNYDWLDAAESGPIPNGQSNYVETVVGPGAVSFWWKVSSEANRDRLSFQVDGVEKLNISGEVDWQWRTFEVTNVSQVLRWQYMKDASGSAGQDRAWLDQVSFGPAAPVIDTPPMPVLAELGASATFKVSAIGTRPFDYRWRFNGNLLFDNGTIVFSTNSTMIVSNVQPVNAGDYSVIVENPGGRDISTNVTLTLFPGQPISDALETTGQLWNGHWITGGDAYWQVANQLRARRRHVHGERYDHR